MMRNFQSSLSRMCTAFCLAVLITFSAAAPVKDPASSPAPLRKKLDAPLLFVKRHSYQGIHIYDTYYKWGPGGGIYIIENPWDPPEEHKVRPLIDPGTAETLGEGIYYDPELSWDAQRLLFCFKPTAAGHSSIYEIKVDGTGLRRLTDPSGCAVPQGRFKSHHDVGPAYLPDGRIVFTSTRPNGLVPCNNTGVDILHVMNADGSDIHPISVNNVNEFDPALLPDGRILHGRWEYVDKTALTQQSLWTIFPDGTNETALYANNLVHPEALLDARAVPGSDSLIVATFTPHNAPPRGCIGLVDFNRSKNHAVSLFNFDHPENPQYDRGNSCEPWPLSDKVMLFSGRPAGFKRNIIEMIDRSGRRETIYRDPAICCHSPMLVKPGKTPPPIPLMTERKETMGRFFVQDIYQGLAGIERGEVAWLRVIEETSRATATPNGAYNQTFLISAALAFSAKNFLGMVPVRPDGSVYFEVPSGRTIYFQALDSDKRLIQSMRTFVQAAPGVTRSCIGCHEHKGTTPSNTAGDRMPLLGAEPAQLQPESWGTGHLDYPSHVQPVLDKHCAVCHGGKKGIAGRLDLTGGWTEHFSISYENLASRKRTQLVASLISGIDCMNGTALWSAQIFPPRAHGSGAAPLAQLLVDGHDGYIEGLSRKERDLLLAWIDTNGLYHGTWDYTDHGCQLGAWQPVRQELIGAMRGAGCMKCHEQGGAVQFEDDWFNLRRPELSRILRAPLKQSNDGLGLGWCRDRSVNARKKRIRMMLERGYVHHVLPLDSFTPEEPIQHDESGSPVYTFQSTDDPDYRAMLEIIQRGKQRALAAPRVDMPGAVIRTGACRHMVPPPLPDPMPLLKTALTPEGTVQLSWECSARTIGLTAHIHRSAVKKFTPSPDTQIALTEGFSYEDLTAEPGECSYALVFSSGKKQSQPVNVQVTVPVPPKPPAPTAVKAMPFPGFIELAWKPPEGASGLTYHVYRTEKGKTGPLQLTEKPLAGARYIDGTASHKTPFTYMVRSVNRRGIESSFSPPVTQTALKEPENPVFTASFRTDAQASILNKSDEKGVLHGRAKPGGEGLDLAEDGYLTFQSQPTFALNRRITVDLKLRLDKKAAMPVVISCGNWNHSGWFLQRIGSGWRWHTGGIDCDGGTPSNGKWVRLTGTFDGACARLYQNGTLVAEKKGTPLLTPWTGRLFIGQYSGAPGAAYQVHGSIADVHIYNRVLTEKDLRGR